MITEQTSQPLRCKIVDRCPLAMLFRCSSRPFSLPTPPILPANQKLRSEKVLESIEKWLVPNAHACDVRKLWRA